MNKYLKLMTAIILTLMLLFPSQNLLAQEQTPTQTPPTEIVVDLAEQTPEATAPVTQPTTPTNPTTPEPVPTADGNLDDVLVIMGTIILAVIVGGSFIVTITALDALKISVPPDTVAHMSDQLANTVEKTMQNIGQGVQATLNPYDDAVYAVGRIGSDKVVNILRKWADDPEAMREMTAIVQAKPTAPPLDQKQPE